MPLDNQNPRIHSGSINLDKLETHLPVCYFNNRKQEIHTWVKKTHPLTPRVAAMFDSGQCHALAIALHEILDWPIYGVSYRGGKPYRGYYHFVVLTPPIPPHGIRLSADMQGIRCIDWSLRRTNPAAISRLVRKDGGWLPLAMNFARHYAPTVATALLDQVRNMKIGQPRPEWTLYTPPERS